MMKIYLEGFFNIILDYYNILSINFISLRKYSESGKRHNSYHDLHNKKTQQGISNSPS